MIFIIDSGSTKCDWIAIDPKTGHQVFEKQRTKGLNPAIISENEAFEIIKKKTNEQGCRAGSIWTRLTPAPALAKKGPALPGSGSY